MLEVFTYNKFTICSTGQLYNVGVFKSTYAPFLVFGDKILAAFTLLDCLLVICSFVTLSIVNGSLDSLGRIGLVFILFFCAINDR